MITDFPTNPTLNQPGIAAFEFIPAHWLNGMPPLRPGEAITSLQLPEGEVPLKGYATQETLVFTESASQENAGQLYRWQIGGFAPGDSPELCAQMAEMEQCRYLVIIKDRASRDRLVGYGAPLEFTASFSSGARPGDARGYEFSFSGDSATRAPAYLLG